MRKKKGPFGPDAEIGKSDVLFRIDFARVNSQLFHSFPPLIREIFSIYGARLRLQRVNNMSIAANRFMLGRFRNNNNNVAGS